MSLTTTGTEVVYASKIFIQSTKGGNVAGHYYCSVPCQGCQTRCHLEWLYKFDLGPVAIPAILLPITVVISWVVWCCLFRKQVMARLLRENDSLDEKAGGKNSDKIETPEFPSVLSAEAPRDAEAQEPAPVPQSRIFKYSNTIFEIWFRGFAMTRLLKDIIEQNSPIHTPIVPYGQQILGLSLEGLLFKPRSRKVNLMLSGAWILLALRDVVIVNSSSFPIFGMRGSLTAGLCVIVGILIPLISDLEETMTVISMSSAAFLVVFAITPFIGAGRLAKMRDHKLTFYTTIVVMPSLTILVLWPAIRYLRKHRDIPLPRRFAELCRQFVRIELLVLAHDLLHVSCTLGGIGLAGLATMYLTACVGLPRLIFSVAAESPKVQGLAGVIGFIFWSVVLFVSSLPLMGPSLTKQRGSRLMAIKVSETVPLTLVVVLVIAGACFAQNVGDEANVIHLDKFYSK